MLLIQVNIKVDDQIPFKSQKSDLEVFIEGPEDPKISILGGERGNFHVGFNPSVAGQFWMDFVYKGTVANEPFLLPVKDMFNKVPEVTYTGKYRGGTAVTQTSSTYKTTTPTSPTTKPVTATSTRNPDKSKLEEEERLSKEKQRLEAAKHEEERLKEKQRLEAAKRDEEERLSKEKLEADNLKREEEERLRKEKLRLEAEEKDRNRLDGRVIAVTFIFRALNRYGKPKSTGGDTDAFEVTANGEKITLIEDAGDGTYTVDYNSVPGNNEVDVKYKGHSIKGFPVQFFRKSEGD